MGCGEVLDVALRVAATFERLDIPYLVGGSLASSLHGLPRATQDVDFVADLEADDVDRFISGLGAGFYIDTGMIEDAMRNRSSFNLIDLGTMFKVDVFIPKADLLAREEMRRRQAYVLPGPDRRTLMVASPEDIILQKLHWYRLGNRVSDRQLADAVGVIRVRRDELDLEYLDAMAGESGLSDLLREALDLADRD